MEIRKRHRGPSGNHSPGRIDHTSRGDRTRQGEFDASREPEVDPNHDLCVMKYTLRDSNGDFRTSTIHATRSAFESIVSLNRQLAVPEPVQLNPAAIRLDAKRESGVPGEDDQSVLPKDVTVTDNADVDVTKALRTS